MAILSGPWRALWRWLREGEIPPASLEVAAAARGWGLAGLLDTATTAAWPPGPARDAVHREHLRLVLRGTHQLQAAAELIDRLAHEDLRALPMKGAAVAETLYVSVGHRPMADVDILALDDWGASVATLRQAGLLVKERADHAWSFDDPRGRGLVELHQGLTSCPRLFPIDADGLWNRSRLRVDTQVTRVPSAEDLLVQLALHAAFQHGLAISPVQYLDLRRLMERDLDVARVRALAAAAHAERALACALFAAEAAVGAVVPSGLRDALEQWMPPTRSRWLHRIVTDQRGLLSPATDPPLSRVRWALAAGRRWRLLRDTLAPQPLGDSSRPGTLRTVRRALALAGRGWAAPRRLGRGPGPPEA
jgi:hypothetical protein